MAIVEKNEMNPFLTFGEQLEYAARIGAAYLLVAFFFLFDLVSFSSIGADLANLPFFLIAVYYWSLYRPTLLPVWLVFIAGFITDAVSGAPLGVSAALYVLVRWVIGQQRRYLAGQNFPVVWLGFMFVLAFSLLFQWVVIGLVNWRFSPPADLGGAFLCGVAIFPLINVVLHITHRLLPVSDTRMHIS